MNTRTQLAILLIGAAFTLSSNNLFAGNNSNDLKTVNYKHAKEFGKLLVQDNKGRIKPVNSLTGEVIRKITGKDKFAGLHANQVFLGMMALPKLWKNEPMIKIKHPELRKLIEIDSKYAAYNDFFNDSLEYLLSRYVYEAYKKPPAYQSKLDKEIIKVDERVNICYLVYTGVLLKIFPREGDTNNTWYSAVSAAQQDFDKDAGYFVRNYIYQYIEEVNNATKTGRWKKADEALGYLNIYQQKFGKELIPSDSKIYFEILYNDLNIFKRLSAWYGLFGFVLLITLFVNVFSTGLKTGIVIKAGILLLALCFVAHTTGLVVRWHISEHAPWSNGYESMIYIAWATMLAGFIFARKSLITIAATAILSSLTLWVAGLSWMDPEITTLVPVLKSYWLTIHVSLITASYGFLALGMLLGFINLVFMIFSNRKKSTQRINLTIKELTYVNDITLTIGLFMLTIGTFLGGVWANESWGRYWGWDPKETWALITVLVYTFILHMRSIPGMKDLYIFNFASVIGYSSVIMTYFGVNYYLSGLHSYATGDPVPVPDFVYYTLAVITVVSALAYYNYSKVKETGKVSNEI